MNIEQKAANLTTVEEFLHFATKSFKKAKLYFGHGTDNAWDEAVALILHCLNLPPGTGREILNRILSPAEKKTILTLIQKRCDTRTPLPYLLHEAYFGPLKFYVDERVLIPRSPMAELIENKFEPWIPPQKVHKILDLCTGSGCIAIACAASFPQAEVDASDISQDCLEVARINIEKYQLESRVNLYQSDLFNELPKKTYDIIISNPPYVDAKDMANLPKEYHHEPKLALSAGKEGLDLVHRILAQAKNYLSPQGILVVEVGNSETAVRQRYPQLPFIWLTFQRGGDGVFLLEKKSLCLL